MMITDLAQITDMIPPDQRHRRSYEYRGDFVLNLSAIKGELIECSFNGYTITIELYEQLYAWMESGLTWQEWLDYVAQQQEQTYQPSRGVVDSSAVVVEEGFPLLSGKI